MAQETFKRTNTSTANKKVFTYSFWMKGNDILTGNQARPIYNYDGSTLFQLMIERSTGTNPGYWVLYANGTNIRWEGKRVDPSAWYHVILSANTTRTRDVDRVVFYIDGVRMNVLGSQTGSPGTPGYPSLNLELYSGVNYINGISGISKYQLTDFYYVDGQALDGDVFGFNKEGNGYSSVGSTYSKATDFRPGQWSPHSPRRIKTEIERRGGFGANGYYLPMNDSSNPGADFHCTPNSIIKLKGEDLPQPRNGAPTTSDAYVSQLREEKGSEDLPFEGVARFGGDGTNSSLKFPDHSDLELGGGPFTAECWIYPQDTSGNNFGALFNKGFGFQVYWKSDNENLQLFASNDGSNYNMINGVTSQNGSVPKGKWCHIAVTRSGNTWYMFTNGKLTYGPLTVSGTVHANGNPWAIGDYAPVPGSYEFKGFVSDFRLVHGTAVYTAPFTPPTTRLTNITNTKLLCCQSATSVTEAAVAPTTGGTAGGANTFATKNEMTGSISIVVPGISTTTGANLLTNGGFDTDLSGWTTVQATTSWKNGLLRIVPDSGVNGAVYQEITTVVGKRYTVSMEVVAAADTWGRLHVGTSTNMNSANKYAHTSNLSVQNVGVGKWTTSFTATTTTTVIWLEVGGGSQTQIDFDNVVCKQEDAPRDYSSDIRGSGSNLTLTPSGNAGVGYELDGYYGSAINLNATNGDEINVDGSSSNVDLQLGGGDFTIEAWVYPKVYNSGNMDWIGKNSGASNTSEFEYGILSSGEVCFYHGDGSGYSSSGNNGIVLPAGTAPLEQWTHIATERYGNKWTVYINGVVKGVIQNFLGGGSMPSGSADLCIGNDSATNHASNWHWNGRVQDLRIYKGVAKYKGGFDVSKPYNPRGIESWRTTPDTPTNNFATLNHHFYQTTGTYGTHKPGLSNGNLTFSKANNNNWERSHASIGVGEGKWYYEFMAVDTPKAAANNSPSENWAVGVRESDSNDFYKETDGFEDIGDHVYWADAGNYRIVSNQDRSSGSTTGITAATDGDIINIAFEKTATTLKVWFGLNGTYFNSGNPGSGTNPAVDVASTDRFIIPSAAGYCYSSQNAAEFDLNFGQNQSFSGRTTAGTNTDSNGKGMFKYPVPTGFLSLCEDNLPTPTIPDPGKHFKTVLWTGDGNAGRGITGVGFKPDLVWIKDRGDGSSHCLFDSVRGAGIWLGSDSNAAQQTGYESVYNPSFDSDGFGVGTDGAVNGNGSPYVAWCWKAGGSAVTNNVGSISSQMSVNETAGFSIVSYIGNGANGATVGHGLPKAPSFIVSKNTDNTYGWPIYHQSTQNTGNSATDVVYFNENSVGNSDNIRSVNDTTFGLTNWGGINYDTKKHIAYCWTEIEGFSRFSSYLGNGNNDGTFVYCGFRPAYVIIKNVSATGEWCMWDSSRTPHNEMQWALRSNSPDLDVDGFQFDFLCNGFKARDTEGSVNANGDRYIFAAFAESPFKTANAR